MAKLKTCMKVGNGVQGPSHQHEEDEVPSVVHKP